MDTSNQTPRRLFQLAVFTTVRLSMFAAGAFLNSHLSAQSPAATPAPEASPPSIQSDDSPSATVTFASGASTQISSQSGYFPLVASNAGEAHTINLQLPATAPRNLIVQPLDGGALGAGAQSSAVSVDGTTSFQFQLGMKAGRYRVLLNDGGVTTLLQFWVADPQNPQANPPAVQAE